MTIEFSYWSVCKVHTSISSCCSRLRVISWHLFWVFPPELIKANWGGAHTFNIRELSRGIESTFWSIFIQSPAILTCPNVSIRFFHMLRICFSDHSLFGIKTSLTFTNRNFADLGKPVLSPRSELWRGESMENLSIATVYFVRRESYAIFLWMKVSAIQPSPRHLWSRRSSLLPSRILRASLKRILIVAKLNNIFVFALTLSFRRSIIL